MNKKVAVLMAIVPLLLTAVGGTVFASTPSQLVQGSAGNYSFDYNATTSTLVNLSYANSLSDSEQNITIANSVTISNGNSTSSGTELMVPVTLNSTALDNATILNSGSRDVFLMVSNYQGAWVNYSLVSAPQQVNLDLGNSLSLLEYKLGFPPSNYLHPHYWVYSTIVNGTQFYLFSNSPVTVSTDNVAVHSSGYVITGLITFSALANKMANMNNLREDYFSYNNTTGAVNGSYLNFNFNESTGMFTAFERSVPAQIVASPQVIFTNFYATGNGNLTSSPNFPAIPVDQATVFGSVFVYANNTSVFAIHNNPALQSSMLVENGTLYFTLAPGLNATVISTPGTDDTLQPNELPDNASGAADTYLGANGTVRAGQHGIVIRGNGTTVYMLLQGGIPVINGSNISVSTSKIALVSFVSPPGLQFERVRTAAMLAIERAIQDGRIAGIVEITGSSGANASVLINFNTTVQTSVVNVTSGKAVVDLSSVADHHLGTNVLIYISNSVIANTSNVKVTFDNTTISVKTVDGVLNTSSSTSAYFAELKVPGGMLIVLHVPHFSSHTLTITPASTSSTTTITSSHGAKLLYLGGVVAAIVVIAAIVTRHRKKFS